MRVPDDRREAQFLDAFRGIERDATSLKRRAEQLGWVRGPVLGNGSVHAYVKKSPAGFEAVLALDGISVTALPRPGSDPGPGRLLRRRDLEALV